MRPAPEQPVLPGERRVRGGRRHSTLRDRVVVFTTVLAVALFLAFGIPFVKRNLPSAMGVVDVGGVPAFRDAVADPDRDAVREWLRENVRDPRPREIRWWPARELTELHRRRLEEAKELIDDDPSAEALLDQLERDGPDRVCRLKYRTTNEVGAQVSADKLFLVRNGKARLLRPHSVRESEARKYFPNDGGTP